MNGKSVPLAVISRAFTEFNHAAMDLQRSFAQLECRAKELDLELEQRNTELAESLSESKRVKGFLKDMLESLRSGILVLRNDREISTWNAAACDITGISFSRHKGRNFYLLLRKKFPFNERGIKKLQALGYEEEYVFDLDTASGSEYILFTKVPLRKEPKKADPGCMLVFQNITEWKRLEKQAERNKRLIALGEFATKMVSEVRNPLGSIEIFASMLKRDLAGDAKGKTAGHIINAVRSLDNLLANYLIFTESPKPRIQQLPAQGWLDDSLEFVAALPRTKPVQITREYRAHQAWIMGDPELLKQVALNLVLNAIQAMPDGGRLTVCTKNRKRILSEEDVNKKVIAISFKDTGTGIMEEDLEKIFNPFFTTRAGSAGLGLATVNNIIRAHGGAIEVSSSAGKGTAFTIYLPVVSPSECGRLPKSEEMEAGIR
ncbi:MAG: ATP-binding protein [Pseudomonadota bacterium]